ncbi:MAG: long-chain-acyl-CoA synthetase [Promethearchaeota archaeon]|jgi:citronellyl-CoA synthetase
MENEIQLTPKETDYFERLNKIVEPRVENPNLSPGILIEQHAEDIPDNPALFYEDNSWSWNTFNQESNKIANYFLKKGCKPLDTVGVMMENSPQFLFITTALNKIKAISSLINVNQRKKALIHAFKISDVKWIIIDGDSLPAFNDVFSDLGIKKENVFVINNPYNKDHNYIDFQREIDSISTNNPKTTSKSSLSDISMYIFTSGTTGLPKAAVQNNARLLNPFGYLAFQITQNDVLYSPLPLYHSHATVNGWGTVMNGGCAFAIRKRFSASKFWKDIKKFGATCCLYIGELPRYLLNRPKSEYVKNTTLKKMLGLGLRKDIWAEFKSRFHIEHILEFYGATDGAGGLFNIEEVPGMIGRITVPESLEIVKIDEATGEFLKNNKNLYIKCKPSETGMLLVKIQTTSNFLGYKDKNKTETRVLRNIFEENNEYFNTGDLVTLHEDHWVSFADRFGDTFRWKGENVSTLEVEAIINGFDNIEMCTVYGVEIPKSEGKAGMVCIKLEEKKAFDTELFSQFVKDNLPKYAIPIFLRIGDKLDFTGTHKLRKVNLKKQGYDINKIQDRIFIWDSLSNTYKKFSREQYQSLMNNEMML